MSDLPSNTLTFARAKRLFTNKTQCYHAISEIYKLPSLTSAAITANYLIECMKENCAFFRIEHKDFHPPYIRNRPSDSSKILEAIEQLLKEKNYPPTGINKYLLPDFDWLVGVYFFLDEKDKLGLFPHSRKPETKIQISIDPRILKAIEDHDPPPRQRSILKLDKKIKTAYEQEMLERKLKRHERMQDYLAERLEVYEKSIQTLEQKLQEIGKTQGEYDKEEPEPELKKKLKIFNELESLLMK